MTIGALNAYGAQPYVYNTNNVSSASMNKLSRISDNVLDRKVDYNELTDEEKNVNPLRKGQTLDFQSVLERQMVRGQNAAARVMKAPQEAENTTTARDAQNAESTTARDAQTAKKPAAQSTGGAGRTQQTAAAQTETSAEAEAGRTNISYQMQQALEAYGMFMTA